MATKSSNEFFGKARASLSELENSHTEILARITQTKQVLRDKEERCGNSVREHISKLIDLLHLLDGQMEESISDHRKDQLAEIDQMEKVLNDSLKKLGKLRRKLEVGRGNKHNSDPKWFESVKKELDGAQAYFAFLNAHSFVDSLENLDLHVHKVYHDVQNSLVKADLFSIRTCALNPQDLSLILLTQQPVLGTPIEIEIRAARKDVRFVGLLSVSVQDKAGTNLAPTLRGSNLGNSAKLSFVAAGVGEYVVSVRLYKEHISNSPISLTAASSLSLQYYSGPEAPTLPVPNSLQSFANPSSNDDFSVSLPPHEVEDDSPPTPEALQVNEHSWFPASDAQHKSSDSGVDDKDLALLGDMLAEQNVSIGNSSLTHTPSSNECEQKVHKFFEEPVVVNKRKKAPRLLLFDNKSEVESNTAEADKNKDKTPEKMVEMAISATEEKKQNETTEEENDSWDRDSSLDEESSSKACPEPVTLGLGQNVKPDLASLMLAKGGNGIRGRFVQLLGEMDKSEPKESCLSSPLGCRSDPKTKDLLVCDTGNHVVKVYSQSGEPKYMIPCEWRQELKNPSVAIPLDGDELLVKDDKGIYVYSKQGIQMRQLAALRRPFGLALDTQGRALTLVDTKSDLTEIHFYDVKNGTLLSRLEFSPKHQMTDEEKTKSQPRFLDVSGDTLAVTDLGLQKVYIISLKDGRTMATFGSNGRGPGQFSFVSGIQIDSAGNFLIGDARGNRVQLFDACGGFMCQLKFDAPGTPFVSDIHLTEDGFLMVSLRRRHAVAVYKLESAK